MEHLANKTWPKPNGKWVKMSQATKADQPSPAQQAAPSRVASVWPQNNCGIMYRTVLQGRQLCLQFLQLQDGSWTGREEGRGRETPADFIVMALMKMVLLQSFLA